MAGILVGVLDYATSITNHATAPERIMWSSRCDKLDATILKLTEPVTGIEPLRATNLLPLLDGTQRVYVIENPGGGDLKISFQDNLLLDHEGPTAGTPVDPTVCHLHYRAPTEKERELRQPGV